MRYGAETVMKTAHKVTLAVAGITTAGVIAGAAINSVPSVKAWFDGLLGRGTGSIYISTFRYEGGLAGPNAFAADLEVSGEKGQRCTYAAQSMYVNGAKGNTGFSSGLPKIPSDTWDTTLSFSVAPPNNAVGSFYIQLTVTCPDGAMNSNRTILYQG
ncbi:hypothetical protein [Nocardia sp. NPDC051570]|uniref:hypothetical protein n=1 Tax=Nocardia sp. NPDC051570 TaxID=3364324 RepID=UPI0037AF8088